MMRVQPTRTNMQARRLLALLCAAAMLVALLKMPIGYYTFLRLLATAGAVVDVVHHYRRGGLSIRVVLFGLVALVFNPIWRVHLGDRELWEPINAVAAVLFLYAAVWPAGRKERG
jgi:hypothetical protein